MIRYQLWDGDAPGFDPAYGDFQPFMEVYPAKGDKPAPCIVIFPGGAYAMVSLWNEGYPIAELVTKHGFAAAVVHYRVAPYAYPAPVLDAQRAVRAVRYHAKEWGVDPDRIGTIGFSAGGHLCCMSALLFDDGLAQGDEIDRTSCRISTAAPCYAVTSFDSAITHADTRKNFLGAENTDERAAAFSSENMLRDDAPAFFIWHTATDGAVPVACALRLADALTRRRLSCELLIYPEGDHGLGLAQNTPLADAWPAAYLRWLDAQYHVDQE